MIINPYRFGGAVPPVSSLLDDLNHWWNLNEASGDRLDSHGGLTLAPNAGVGYDAVSDSATFNGTSDGRLNGSGPTAGATGFTIAFWINRDTGAGGARGYASAAGTNEMLIYALADGRIDWRIGGSTQIGVYQPAENTWECWTFTTNGTNMKIFVNGVLSDIESQSYATPVFSNIVLGNQATRYFQGKMKRAAIWNVALDDGGTTTVGATATGRVADFYNGGTPLLYADL